MQERKFGSAFRLSNRQFDSLKTKNSLGQLLGTESVKRIEDYPKMLDSDIEIPASQSTSTLIRCGPGSRNTSKENFPGSNLGLKGAGTSFLTPDFCEKLFGLQSSLLTKGFSTIEHTEPVTSKSVDSKATGLNGPNSTAKFDKSIEFIYSMFSGLAKHQPAMFNPLFDAGALKDESNKHQQAFLSKLEQLRNLEQQFTLAQASENRFGSKKVSSQAVSFPNLKVESNLTGANHTKGSFHDISSLNSLDEELDMGAKLSPQYYHHSSNHLESSPSKAKSELSLTTRHSEDYKSCNSVDLYNAPLPQRIELHHAKNRKCNSGHEEIATGKGASVPGTYSQNERINKILKYKKKIIKWRAAHPPNRNFSGRSAVAGSKPRIKGKFVKKDEYQKYLEVAKTSPTN